MWGGWEGGRREQGYRVRGKSRGWEEMEILESGKHVLGTIVPSPSFFLGPPLAEQD